MAFFGKKKQNKDASQDAVEQEDTAQEETSSDEASSGKKKLFGGGKPKKEKAKPVKGKKGKKSKKKKKDMTLVERMGLEESVAAATLDALQEQDTEASAVRKLDDGYLIVSLTNAMMEDAGIDPSSEDFGSFAQALRTETIGSITLEKDLENQVIGIIPSLETLETMDEFDFVRDMKFIWTIVPFDLSDEDELVLLEDTTEGLTALFDLAYEERGMNETQLVVEDGEVAVLSGPSESEDESFETNVSDNVGDVSDEPLGDEIDYPQDDDIVDVPDDLDDDLPVDDMDVYSMPDDSTYDMPNYDSFDTDYEAPADFGDDAPLDDLDLGEPSFEAEEPELTADEQDAQVEKALERTFYNDELGLSINMETFDDHFNSMTVPMFNTERQDDSELQRVVAELRRDGNVQIERYRQESVNAFRNKYVLRMGQLHEKLVESFDHKDTATTYGAHRQEIEATFHEGQQHADRKISERTESLRKDYDQAREAHGDAAKEQAMQRYDELHKRDLTASVGQVRDNYFADLENQRDADMADMYADRKLVAKRMYDKMSARILRDLQNEFQKVLQNELKMYDAFRKNIDAFLRNHFSDEVLRSKAQAEALRQSHEADTVREEYEQMLKTSRTRMEEQEARAQQKLRELEQTHQEQLTKVQKDFGERIELEKRDNEKLRSEISELNENLVKLDARKQEEVESKIRMLENTIDAKDRELTYANERSQKPMWIISIGIGIAALALGVLFGFMYATNQTNNIAPSAPEQQPQAQEQSYSLLDTEETSVAVFDNVIDISEILSDNHVEDTAIVVDSYTA